jgi:predicted kinase
MKFIINRGLPGSGKSTLTKQEVQADYNGTVRINRDDIRNMLHDNVWKGTETESVVMMMRDSMIRSAMKARKPLVISDDTNLDSRVVKQLAKIAEFFGYGVEVRDFDTPLKVCIERDAQRVGTARVGEDVIRGMHKKFFKGGQFPENPLGKIEVVTFERYVANQAMPKAAIFDIDGTLASHEGIRSPYDYTKVIHDTPRNAVIDAASVYHKAGYKIIVMSGRDGGCRPDTEKWLNRELIYGENDGSIHQIPYTLFMRAPGDKRQDRIIKGELFNEHVRDFYNVEVVFDDRDQVVDLWRLEFELNCFQVNYGRF